MAANVDAMVREGISALKAGNKETARDLFEKVLEINEHNEQAWLWMSAVLDSQEDQRTCLENVLAINPHNERAIQGLKYLDQPPMASPTPSEPPPPAPEEAFTSYAAMPSSVEWGAPEPEPVPSSPQPPKRGMELSQDDYDSWVNNLNLPANDPESSVSPFYNEVDDLPDLFEVDEEPIEPLPKRQERAVEKEKPRPSEPAVDFDDDAFEAIEYEPLFPDIPDEIKATRLPGTTQRLPFPIIIILGLLLGLNVAAAILLVQSLLSA